MMRIAIAISMAVASPTFAAETLFGTRGAFTSSLAASVTDDYSNPGYVFVQSDAQMSSVLGETDYTTTGFANLNIVSGGYYCAGCNGSFILDFKTTSVTQGNGVFGVGFEFGNDAGLYDALVTFGDGTSLLYDLGSAGFSPSTFWGLTSTRSISSIAFGPGGQASTTGTFAIDNLTIGSAPLGDPGTLFNDRSAFSAQLSSSVTDDYSNPAYVFVQNDADMSAVLGETDYKTTGFANLNIVSQGYYCAGCNGSFILDFKTTSVTQGNGVFGVGFEFGNPDGAFDALVTYGDGGTQLFKFDSAELPPQAFWGLVSERLISSIAFGPNGGATTRFSFGIDNLTIGTAPSGVIPEPTSWALMIAGFGLVGAAARRRTAATA